MFAHAPCRRASSLIQSASYPRSASSIVRGSKALRRTEHSRLSCASIVVVNRRPSFFDELHDCYLASWIVFQGVRSSPMFSPCKQSHNWQNERGKEVSARIDEGVQFFVTPRVTRQDKQLNKGEPKHSVRPCFHWCQGRNLDFSLTI